MRKNYIIEKCSKQKRGCKKSPNKINEWKLNYLFGKFKYISSNIKSEKTALTDSEGKVLEYVTEGNLEIHYSEDRPSDKYLYDLCLYDSDIEKKNIILDNEEVIVFGKIPSKSIRIPIINGSSYSPDFMYVVKKKDGIKEINLVIETNDYDSKDKIPLDQKFKIDCARKFFEMLKEDGYNVKFEVQINTTQILNLIKRL